MNSPVFRLAPLALAVALALGHSLAQAQGAGALLNAPVQLHIAAQPLGQALNDWARQTRIELIVPPALVAGRTASAVTGHLTPRQALDRLLAGSGLIATSDGPAVVVRAAPAVSGATLPAVLVEADAQRETAAGPVQGYVAKRSATATKTDTPILETPQSLTVITADRMAAMGATTLKDALSYTPGVAITTFGADSRYDWLTLRGFDAYAPGFYLDGLPLRNNGNWGVWRTENYGAERIELLRGPASVLYGQASPGGVVNVVSKRPTAEPQRELQMQLGDHNRKQIAGDFSGPLDAEGKVLYRVVGLVRDAELPAEKMPDRRLYLAPSLTWRISGDTRLTLLAQVDRTRAGVYNRIRPQVGSVFPTAIGTRIPASLLAGDPSYDRFHNDQWMVGYEFEHRLNDTVLLRQNARYGELKVDYAGIWPNRRLTTVDAANPLNPANFMLLGRYPTGSREKVSAFSIDNQMQLDLRAGDWQHKLLIGLDYQRNRIDQYSFSTGSAPTINVYAPVYGGPIVEGAPWMNADMRLAQTGLYVQDQIKWGDRWSLTLGGRYDSASNDTFDRLEGKSTRISQHKFTGRAGLVYVMPSGWAPYLSYSESFAPTGLVDPVTRDPFKPETGRQYEAGIRYQPPEGKQSYSAAIFDLRRQNYISYGTGAAPKQTGEISVRGLELEATAELMPRLNVTASYDYTPRAIVTASANPAEIGKQANAVPRHRMSVWANYRFVNGVKVGLGARYNGTSHGDGEKIAPGKVPAATVFDAMLGYDLDRWSLALNVRNIANKDFIANCDQYGKCYYGAPRSVVATATYRW
ncbi:iron complex outermembrane receptor protein [Variovorax sp. 54]|uniref:TonB-dependent siderophore receptor n=1 Tax=Variovorax sp. 54 TaxID=2035212 RepID=UPI000C1937E9|nr:TonB-dependent siderophore receptor [Variovorax sp. 54]PIF77716.1 iron complex outermembrane receptor protein [Variovorax sp. 54]